jgi:hypothetical protein
MRKLLENFMYFYLFKEATGVTDVNEII